MSFIYFDILEKNQIQIKKLEGKHLKSFKKFTVNFTMKLKK